MAVQASANVYAAIGWVLSNEFDLADVSAEQKADLTPIEFTSGTGDYEINKIVSDERSLSASGTENLDLAGGFTDALGNTVTMTAVKAILVIADAGNTNNVVVGGDATNTVLGIFTAEADSIEVKPGGVFMWVAPKTGATVTATTGDLLMITNGSSGTSVTYKIVILGIG